MPIECKVQYGSYQTTREHYLNVYETFKGPITQSRINDIFATVERDAGTVSNALRNAGAKVETRAAVLELSGYYVKIYCQVLVDKVYLPKKPGDGIYADVDYAQIEKASKELGIKIKG